MSGQCQDSERFSRGSTYDAEADPWNAVGAGPAPPRTESRGVAGWPLHSFFSEVGQYLDPVSDRQPGVFGNSRGFFQHQSSDAGSGVAFEARIGKDAAATDHQEPPVFRSALQTRDLRGA